MRQLDTHMRVPDIFKSKKKVAVIVLLLVVILLLIPVPDQATGENSSMNGFAHVRNALGEIIYDTEQLLFPQGLVIGEQGVATFDMGCDYASHGSEIDWATLKVNGSFVHKWYTFDGLNTYVDQWDCYANLGGGKDINNNWDYEEVTAQTGRIESSALDLYAATPSVVVMQLMTEDLRPFSFGANQKGSEAHTCQYGFKATYVATVLDNYGNRLSDTYEHWVYLDVVWTGSKFAVDWEDEEPPAPPTNEPPTVSAVSSVYWVKNGEEAKIQWTAGDPDNNLVEYQLTGDVTQAWTSISASGGTISKTFTVTKSVGEKYSITCTVRDSDGAMSASKITVNVDVDDGRGTDSPPLGSMLKLTSYMSVTDGDDIAPLGIGSDVLIIGAIAVGIVLIYKHKKK